MKKWVVTLMRVLSIALHVRLGGLLPAPWPLSRTGKSPSSHGTALCPRVRSPESFTHGHIHLWGGNGDLAIPLDRRGHGGSELSEFPSHSALMKQPWGFRLLREEFLLLHHAVLLTCVSRCVSPYRRPPSNIHLGSWAASFSSCFWM